MNSSVDRALAAITDGRPRPKRLVAAMSGGVDSSVAAFLMKEAGIEVIGVTLRLRACADEPGETRKACCGAEDAIHARSSAAKIGVSHYFLDYQEDFQRLVLSRAWNEYSKGRTPNPCVLCNRYLKFGRLIDYARELDADGIITGHYARVLADDAGGSGLYRGLDPMKDQSYFLFDIPGKNLAFCRFPLGPLRKTETREIARNLGLANAEKRESQDACFGVRGESFPETLRRVLKVDVRPGCFVDEAGRVLGRHGGVYAYTIGQRRGLGIALGSRGYVSAIRPETGEVVISTDEETLMRSSLVAEEINWLDSSRKDTAFSGSAQVRFAQKPQAAVLSPLPGGRVRITFHKPVRAITPGQAVVMYVGDRLVCGGWIAG
jgi:tRNA-specific 2-thiouridylase